MDLQDDPGLLCVVKLLPLFPVCNNNEWIFIAVFFKTYYFIIISTENIRNLIRWEEHYLSRLADYRGRPVSLEREGIRTFKTIFKQNLLQEKVVSQAPFTFPMFRGVRRRSKTYEIVLFLLNTSLQ